MKGGAANPVRLRYAKRGKIRWISHRDVARALERAFRITELPLAFTGGFSPRPRVSFGLALSTGHESDAEYVDLGASFPSSSPTFKLVSLTKSSAKIGIAGGSLATGQATVTLKLNKQLTLMNTADGKRYVLRLLSVK